MMDSVNADARMRRLTDALMAVSGPLTRLFEYADNLEELVGAHETMQATCVAAAIRAEAGRLQHHILESLGAVEEAATEVVVGRT